MRAAFSVPCLGLVYCNVYRFRWRYRSTVHCLAANNVSSVSLDQFSQQTSAARCFRNFHRDNVYMYVGLAYMTSLSVTGQRATIPWKVIEAKAISCGYRALLLLISSLLRLVHSWLTQEMYFPSTSRKCVFIISLLLKSVQNLFIV